VLKPLIPHLASADLSQPFDRLALPPELKRAVIVYKGELTPDYAYLDRFLAPAAPP
jgi:alpha-aminoadipic semialdehyde synthase